VDGQLLQDRISKLPDSKKYSVTYDKFTDKTRVSVKFNIRRLPTSKSLANLIIGRAHFEFPGKEFKPVENYYLVLNSACYGPCFKDDNDIIFLVGESRITLNSVSYENDERANVPKAVVYEIVTYSATGNVLKSIATGGPKVEFRYGKFEGYFDKDDLSYIANILMLGEK
jgi:hypothetical protein